MSEVQILLLTAVSISFLHTLAGPDHYLPFVALARSRGWGLMKTVWWTLACGFGHVASSVLLGLGGAALGWSVAKIGWLQEVRGGIAGWAFLLFGLIYTAWGFWRAAVNSRHKHFDVAADGSVSVFEHRHGESVAPSERHTVTPWVMFIIFLLGPCEPMIPLLSVPAAKFNTGILVLLVTVYTFFTLATMIVMVLLGYFGSAFIKTAWLEKHMHALGGLTILLCGAGMLWMGW